MNKGQLIVISGPSGCGKDTVLGKVMERIPYECALSVSMTTRAMRENEAEGVDYYYVDTAEFEKNIENNNMLEYAKYGANYYGTPLPPVKKQIDEGKIVFLNIDVQGGESVRKLYPEVVEIFVMPPSLSELERRLRSRATDDESSILTRLKIAETEIKRAQEYDYIIVNDDLDEAVEDVLSIIRAEKYKTKTMKNIISEVINNA